MEAGALVGGAKGGNAHGLVERVGIIDEFYQEVGVRLFKNLVGHALFYIAYKLLPGFCLYRVGVVHTCMLFVQPLLSYR